MFYGQGKYAEQKQTFRFCGYVDFVLQNFFFGVLFQAGSDALYYFLKRRRVVDVDAHAWEQREVQQSAARERLSEIYWHEKNDGRISVGLCDFCLVNRVYENSRQIRRYGCVICVRAFKEFRRVNGSLDNAASLEVESGVGESVRFAALQVLHAFKVENAHFLCVFQKSVFRFVGQRRAFGQPDFALGIHVVAWKTDVFEKYRFEKFHAAVSVAKGVETVDWDFVVEIGHAEIISVRFDAVDVFD